MRALLLVLESAPGPDAVAYGEILAMVHLIACDLSEITEPVLAGLLHQHAAAPLDADGFAHLSDLPARLAALSGHALALGAEAAAALDAARALALRQGECAS